jgi:hypothetical protein
VKADSAHSTLRILDEADVGSLNSDELRHSLFTWNRRRVRTLAEAVSATIANLTTRNPDQSSVFDFFASSILRGESLCHELKCQNKQLDLLGRFSALYADRVTVPIGEALPTRWDESDTNDLCDTINRILRLRPLIEAGIVQLVDHSRCFCTKCLTRQGVDLTRLEVGATRFWRSHSKEFELIYRRDREESMIEVHGPQDYLPHPLIVPVSEFHELERKKPVLIKGNYGVRIPKTLVKGQNLLGDLVFPEYVGDFVTQQLYGAFSESTYLTDSPGQIDFLKSLGANKDEGRLAGSSLITHLAHSVPVFGSVPLSTLIRLRKNEPEAFIRYRATINNIVRTRVASDRRLTAKEAKEVYEDELRPCVAELRTVSKTATRTGVRQSIVKAGASALAVSIGLFSGLLPSEYSAIFSAIGGISFLRDMAATMASIKRDSPEVRNHNLYFLLSLDREFR